MEQTPYQKTPIYPMAQAAGARFEPQVGWLEAVTYPSATVSPAMGLVDQSHYGKVLVQGGAGQRLLEAARLPAPEEIGRGVRLPGLWVYRLRLDQWVLVTRPGEAEVVMSAMHTHEESGAIATDLTHGRALLRLVGEGAEAILSQLCPLDFHPGNFPDGCARQTSVARTSQLIIRDDVPMVDGRQARLSFCLIGPRSLGAYLWKTLLDAGSALGLRAIGSADL